MCRSLKFISVLPQGRRSGLKLRKLIIYRCTLKMDFFHNNFLFFVFFIFCEKSKNRMKLSVGSIPKKQKNKSQKQMSFVWVGTTIDVCWRLEVFVFAVCVFFVSSIFHSTSSAHRDRI